MLMTRSCQQQLPHLHESVRPQHLCAGSRMEHLKRANVIVGQGQVIVRLDQEIIVETCTTAAPDQMASINPGAGKHSKDCFVKSDEPMALGINETGMMIFQIVYILQGQRCNKMPPAPGTALC